MSWIAPATKDAGDGKIVRRVRDRWLASISCSLPVRAFDFLFDSTQMYAAKPVL
jgi:hypothetical protein